MKEKQKRKRSLFIKYIIAALSVVSILAMLVVYFLNVLPFDYFLVLLTLVLIVDGILIKVLLSRKKFLRKIASVFAIILSLTMIFGIIYGFNTINFLSKLGFANYKTENYSVIVLNSSKSEELADIKNKTLGTTTLEGNEGLAEAVSKINKKVSVDYEEADDVLNLADKLLDEDVDAILVEDSKLAIAEEEYANFSDDTKVIYTFSIDIKTTDLTKEKDIAEESYNIYISGIDTFGTINSVSRSDVNIVLTVNPKTNEILMTNIPRDYYVYLHGITSNKDKLTHAGLYGIDMSIKTIEDLLDTDINYYIKVNFTSVIKIVDALGGITVDSPYTFTSQDGYKYYKGNNVLTGKKALSFARERHSFKDGDRVRGQNQQRVIEAMFNKMMSPKIIVKYNSILSALSDNFVTNLGNKNITKFVKRQIDTNADWTIKSISLDGTDASEYTYTVKRQKLYVMEPDQASVNTAKSTIKSVLEGE